MKSIACINCDLPSVDNHIRYYSIETLRDYDIAIFDPTFPLLSRIDFSGGGSCISIESTKALFKAIEHWSTEIRTALGAGKTIFVILNHFQEEQGAVSSTLTSKNHRSYSTVPINNYGAIPAKINPKNSRGRKTIVSDPNYRNLFNSIIDLIEYQVVLADDTAVRKTIAAKDGAVVGGVVKFTEVPGHLVALPYFNFNIDRFVDDQNEDEPEDWNEAGLNASRAFVSQLIAIDKHLRGTGELTPPPAWIDGIDAPKSVVDLEEAVSAIDAEILKLKEKRQRNMSQRDALLEYKNLLFETGKPLERAIEKVLRLIGYDVETLRIGDLEIDHVIVGPNGKRMIGESEGKDNSAIDISKFRQLESNIGEDFEREDVNEPAKGLLFGNGFRLTAPTDREEQFTQKSLTNAKRLGSNLIRTADLYSVALYVLDHPGDESYRIACRKAIEETNGGIVEFPAPPTEI